MTRLERYYFLGILGGGQPVDYVSLIQIGTLHFANPANRKDIYVGSKSFTHAKSYQQAFECILKKAFEDGLVKRVESAKTKALRLDKAYLIEPADFNYQITAKGRECLGNEQMARSGDASWYNAQYGFDGTLDKAAKINPNLF